MLVRNFTMDFKWFCGSLYSMTDVYECHIWLLFHENYPEQGAKIWSSNSHIFMVPWRHSGINELGILGRRMAWTFLSLHSSFAVTWWQGRISCLLITEHIIIQSGPLHLCLCWDLRRGFTLVIFRPLFTGVCVSLSSSCVRIQTSSVILCRWNQFDFLRSKSIFIGSIWKCWDLLC